MRRARSMSAFTSSSLRAASARQRAAGGVSAANPESKVRVSPTVKPAASASRMSSMRPKISAP